MWYARAENGVELRGGGEFTFVQLRERYGFCSQAHMEVFDAEKVRASSPGPAVYFVNSRHTMPAPPPRSEPRSIHPQLRILSVPF